MEEKSMLDFQYSLFYNLQFFVQNSSLIRKYFLLFNALDLSGFKDLNFSFGCTGYSRHAMLRALIIKSGEKIKSVPKLIRFLKDEPILCELCGFQAKGLPDESQFYRLLGKTNNSILQKIHQTVNQKLIEEKIISSKYFIMDSKPVMAATRENNFKNPKRNATNKKRKPKRNASAALSYYSYQEVTGKKNNFIFFWGYRTHVLLSKEGIPLVEITLPNNITDAKVAKKLIRKLKRLFSLKKGAIFLADAAYDERDLYNFIVGQLRCRAFFPINPRNQQQLKNFGPHGKPLCDAGVEMKSHGVWVEGLRTRAKFRCPLHGKKNPQHCPLQKPCFSDGKAYGCTKYLDITNDARAAVPRDSDFFKNTFSMRTEVERYFARLGDREVEQTTYYKLRTVKNQMTIAHLSMSLIAYAAAILLKQPDKIRCYETFADDPPLRIAV